MDTKKIVWWIQLILFSILIAFIIPVIFEWIQTRTLEITTSGFKDALFFGIFVPSLVLLTRSIKNDFLVVFVSLLVIFLLLLFFKFGISL